MADQINSDPNFKPEPIFSAIRAGLEYQNIRKLQQKNIEFEYDPDIYLLGYTLSGFDDTANSLGDINMPKFKDDVIAEGLIPQSRVDLEARLRYKIRALENELQDTVKEIDSSVKIPIGEDINQILKMLKDYFTSLIESERWDSSEEGFDTAHNYAKEYLRIMKEVRQIATDNPVLSDIWNKGRGQRQYFIDLLTYYNLLPKEGDKLEE